MKPDRTDYICIAIIVLHFALVGFFYGQLPDPVATHWNSQGVADGFMAKPWGAWLFPVMTLGIYLLFKVLPAISPHGFRMDSFLHVVGIIKLTMVLFMFLVGVVVILSARGASFDSTAIVLSGIGVLLLVLGSYMSKLRKNFFIGIRTPWTLASDEVWARTHRLGGWMFLLAGAVAILSGLTGWPGQGANIIFMVVTAGLVPVVYSFIIYRKLEGLGPDQHDSDR